MRSSCRVKNLACQQQSEADNAAVKPAADLKVCPFCKERIREEAVKCRFCGEWLEEKTPIRTAPPTEFDSLTTGNPKSEKLAAPEQNRAPIDTSVSAAITEKLSPPEPAALPRKPTTATQGSYWYGYLYAAFWGYVTYSCATHLLSTVSKLGVPGETQAQAVYWTGLVIWSGATAFFAYVTYLLAQRLAPLGLVYTLVAIHAASIAARGIYLGELLFWIAWSAMAIVKFREHKKREMDDGTEAGGYELLHEATKLETQGQVQEALTAYQRVAEKYSGTPAASDAEKSAEGLRRKIG